MTVSAEVLASHSQDPKTLGDSKRPDLYTIALWQELSVLRGICYFRPIDDALTALRRTPEVKIPDRDLGN